MSNIFKDLVDAIKDLTKKTKASGSDYTGRVTRVDGTTAYVQLDGADIVDTPVALTINAVPGDKVRVRVNNGRAWLMGNDDAPPTDDRYARKVGSTLSGEIEETNKEVAAVKKTAQTANKIAGNTNQYFWHTQEGTDTGAHITEIPQEEFLADPANGGGNLLARSNGIAVRDGLTELATFSQAGLNVNSYDSNDDLVEIAHLGYGEVETGSGTGTAAYYTLGKRAAGSAIGSYSHAEGVNTTASNYTSHAEGHSTVASKAYSHAEGVNTSATANAAHAEGNGTTASGVASHAQGMGTIASAAGSMAVGRYNVSDSTALFAVGYGTSEARKTALAVHTNGETTITGTLSLTKSQDAEGESNLGPALIVGGERTSNHLELDSNELMAKQDGITPGVLILNNNGGRVDIGPGGLRVNGVAQCYNEGYSSIRTPIGTNSGTNAMGVIVSNASTVGFYGRWGAGASAAMAGRTISCPSSDIRLKENIKETEEEALPIILKIPMYAFDWKDKSRGHQRLGFVVDRMEEIDPNFAIGGGEDEEGHPNYKSVDTFYLQGYEVKAIQELAAQNARLTEKVETLEARVAALEKALSGLITQ